MHRNTGVVRSVLAVLAAALLFGTTGTALALGPEGATPTSVGVMRMAIGGTGLALLAYTLAWRRTRSTHRRRSNPPTPALKAIGLMALTGVCIVLYQPLFFLGTTRNGVALATVVALGSAPILAGLLEWARTRRMPTRTWITATGLAAAGVIVLSIGGSSGGTGEGSAAGSVAGSGNVSGDVGTDILGLVGSIGAGASFAVIANVQRVLLDLTWDPLIVVGSMGASAAVISITALPFVDVSWLGSPAGLVMALWLGLATIAIAYVLFTWGLGGLTAATAATLTLAEPLTATVLGVVIVGERLSIVAVIGLAVITAGLIVLAWGSRTPTDPRPSTLEG